MSEESGRRPVRVTIFGEDYQIRSELGQEYTERCARYVDDAIQEAHVAGHISEPHKAAILAAMRITDELFRARAARDALERDVEARADALARRVEAVLQD